MKKIIQGVFLCATVSLFGQNQGDIAFIGFNADGDKDFAIVTLAELPANTIIYFTDAEPNSDGTGLDSTSEGVLDWNVGASVVDAGTVVVFTDIEASLTASVGTIVDSSDDLGFNISASGDNIFATLGNPATGNVTKWLAGIENRNTGQGTNFAITGLNTTSTYVVIGDTASKDGGKYTGVRTANTVAGYRTLIANEINWTTSTGEGETILPFDTTDFEFLTLSNRENSSIEGLFLSVRNQSIVTNKGKVLTVHNVMGQQIQNQYLSRGLYIVLVKYENKTAYVKIAI
ncbi:hypothetical protein [Wenyingzhuangia sp. 2_MG-2023]|uniref:hypothetical protein n=1 Tax=Wenyingzhuangia sp. 2_MG-2023 TaxID=3062639 RepID=UPI0026E1816F|nr:hypothetical protein [Wenyingzhuangia sp. 2_MG-2023]MDO6736717.1 hypothetical protein [Wenyingzhuangia sp. 2_MG-2023]